MSREFVDFHNTMLPALRGAGQITFDPRVPSVYPTPAFLAILASRAESGNENVFVSHVRFHRAFECAKNCGKVVARNLT
jgi:hypothetical protein